MILSDVLKPFFLSVSEMKDVRSERSGMVRLISTLRKKCRVSPRDIHSEAFTRAMHKRTPAMRSESDSRRLIIPNGNMCKNRCWKIVETWIAPSKMLVRFELLHVSQLM